MSYTAAMQVIRNVSEGNTVLIILSVILPWYHYPTMDRGKNNRGTLIRTLIIGRLSGGWPFNIWLLNRGAAVIAFDVIFLVDTLNLCGVFEGDKKRKKKSGSGSSTSSNSRSSTPTTAVDGASNTIAAAASKLSQDRPGTPCKYLYHHWDVGALICCCKLTN